MAFDVEGRHFVVRDFDALGVGVGIEFAADFEPGFRRRIGNVTGGVNPRKFGGGRAPPIDLGGTSVAGW